MEAEADLILGESSADFSIDTLLEILNNPKPAQASQPLESQQKHPSQDGTNAEAVQGSEEAPPDDATFLNQNSRNRRDLAGQTEAQEEQKE